MPLTPAQPRTPYHRRTIECRGYCREDGLWDIEGHLVDTKSYDFDNLYRGKIAAGAPLHEMWIRLTIDEDFLVREVEVVTDAAPFVSCSDITGAFAALKGLRIGGGFNRKVREMFGGKNGCTHLVDLLGPMATTAYQTLYPIRERKASTSTSRERPKVIDTCHALAADGEVVRNQWPDFYAGPVPVENE
ncbi:MAG: DUF2889 domain-containing protein [Rhodospirillales bacterium]|nr:DUF2889 domain-containing protein [Rhodospirillales bacterium]